MRFYPLNINTEGHLLLPKVAWFLSYLALKNGLYHFILEDVYLVRVVYPYCKGTWLYSQNSEPEGHAVRMHVAWFLRYSTLQSGKGNIKLKFSRLGSSQGWASKCLVLIMLVV